MSWRIRLVTIRFPLQPRGYEAVKLPSMFRRLALFLFGRFEKSRDGQKMPVQTAALPWRRDSKGGIEILLVTSRSSGKWIPPKGWPMRGKSLAEAAAIEAYEEAGVEGRVASRPIGDFPRTKNHRLLGRIQFLVKVHPLEVTRELDAWPERSQRERRWFEQEEAAQAVGSPELAALIRRFDP
jgi:8-oxo-dGTP pyrophosphatase MutT (NUDIX family)